MTEESRDLSIKQLFNDHRISSEKYFVKLFMAQESVRLISILTSGVLEPFLRPNLVNRMAAMLNFNLFKINLKPNVEDQDQSSIPQSPIQLVKTLLLIYLNLDSDEFARALADDEWQYLEKLENVASFSEQVALLTSSQVLLIGYYTTYKLSNK